MKDFDELLDGVLREDASAQPREGLEGRVMARVRADEGLPRSFSQHWSRRRKWLFVPAAACLGVAALIWYGVDGGVQQSQRIDSRVSSSAFSASSGGEMEGDGRSSLGGSGRASRDSHLSDDKAVPKMGHPVLGSARYMDRGMKRVKLAPENEPKLETFPAVSQKGDLAGWLGSSGDGKSTLIAREITPAVAVAYQQLHEVQSEPIDIAAIEIEPLQ